MSLKGTINNLKNEIFPGILNSYSIIFFMNNRVMSLTLLLVSFFNFYAGLSGLYAVVLTILIGNMMKLDKDTLRRGIYTFNALLAGLGMATFFNLGITFFVLLTLISLMSLFLSVALGGWLYKYRLPHLSIPFILSLWLILLPSSHFEHLGLIQRNASWSNEMYALGGDSLMQFFKSINALPIHKMLDIYLRSLSAVFFQSNILSGILIAIALLISSRIFFSLSIVGFLTAYVFAQLFGADTVSITYYNIGANYMMVAFAIGGFFLIPSKLSYWWTVILIPLTSLVLLFFYKIFSLLNLPVFSLPFSVVVILFVYVLQLRTRVSKLTLTPLQHYSPETNLYTFENNKDRLARFLYFPFSLPFWGEWTVSQGHNGKHTHLGEWGKAFDFMIYDHYGKTFRNSGKLLEDFYCFGKPVVAPSAGSVELVIDNVDDNEIGTVDTVNNWGNSIVIKHADGLYSQLSHLKKNTIKVKSGDHVKEGDLLALCGNSGRSPEPHLHFQVQATPELGSKTIDYPFAYYYKFNDEKPQLAQFNRPLENERVGNITSNKLLQNAFEMAPHSTFKFSYIEAQGNTKEENWEAFTDAWNYKYLWCYETKSAAYYANDGHMFYFTAFYGNKKSLLYYFYLSAYKVFLSADENNEITDELPLNVIVNNKALTWLQDFVAPFKHFMHVRFNSGIVSPVVHLKDDQLTLQSEVQSERFKRSNEICHGEITIDEIGLRVLKFKNGRTEITAKCIKA